ncbi:hypothetical protein QYM36_005437 [Artemia franciscana]|uniref:WW domain-containing protein n=1 Tax=Artemia franciscana TaxID=6661 RepID=A0AA88IBB6_ARTSF|nr:hypothetical protein QYM36_005437 [Artemia franciscana]
MVVAYKRVHTREVKLAEPSNLFALSDTRTNVGRPTESSLTDLPVIVRFDSLPVNDYANEPPPILRPVTFNARRGLPYFLVCNTRSLCYKTEDFEARFRIGYWNNRAVNQETQPGKLNSVMRTLDKFRIDIAGLSETRLTGFSTLNSETYHILYSGLETRKEAGFGMALSSRANKCLVDWEPINERILRARFATSQAKLTVIVVYAPTNDTVDQTKDDFYRVLSNVVAKAHRHDIVTLCGNFNAKVVSDASYAPAILGRHGLGEINDNGILLSNNIMINTRKLTKPNVAASGVLPEDRAIPSTASGVIDQPDTASRIVDNVTNDSAGKITDDLTTGCAATAISNITNPESDILPLFTPKTTLAIGIRAERTWLRKKRRIYFCNFTPTRNMQEDISQRNLTIVLDSLEKKFGDVCGRLEAGFAKFACSDSPPQWFLQYIEAQNKLRPTFENQMPHSSDLFNHDKAAESYKQQSFKFEPSEQQAKETLLQRVLTELEVTKCELMKLQIQSSKHSEKISKLKKKYCDLQQGLEEKETISMKFSPEMSLLKNDGAADRAVEVEDSFNEDLKPVQDHLSAMTKDKDSFLSIYYVFISWILLAIKYVPETVHMDLDLDFSRMKKKAKKRKKDLKAVLEDIEGSEEAGAAKLAATQGISVTAPPTPTPLETVATDIGSTPAPVAVSVAMATSTPATTIAPAVTEPERYEAETAIAAVEEPKETEERKKEEAKEEKKEEEAESVKPSVQQDKSRPVSSNPVAGTPWSVVWTGDGRVFFYNPLSRTSVWEKPPELLNKPEADKLVTNVPEAVKFFQELTMW